MFDIRTARAASFYGAAPGMRYVIVQGSGLVVKHCQSEGVSADGDGFAGSEF